MSKRPCVSMGVSCWYLLVFLGPQSMNKNRSCFFVLICLLENAAKVLQNCDITKDASQKDQQGLRIYRKKVVILHTE